jgi:Uma2 family endonuclease
MTGGTRDHARIALNVAFALKSRLRGSPCEALAQDAGVATIGDAVRYPDVLVTCSGGRGSDRLIPGVVAVFEVLGPTSGRTDRIDKLREYQAVPSIRRYVILEYRSPAITVFHRDAGTQAWTADALVAEDRLHLPEIGLCIPVAEFFEGVDFGATDAA